MRPSSTADREAGRPAQITAHLPVGHVPARREKRLRRGSRRASRSLSYAGRMCARSLPGGAGSVKDRRRLTTCSLRRKPLSGRTVPQPALMTAEQVGLNNAFPLQGRAQLQPQLAKAGAGVHAILQRADAQPAVAGERRRAGQQADELTVAPQRARPLRMLGAASPPCRSSACWWKRARCCRAVLRCGRAWRPAARC